MPETATLEQLRMNVTAKLGALSPYRLGFITAIDRAISERDRARTELAELRQRVEVARRLIQDGRPLTGDPGSPVFLHWMLHARAWLAAENNHGR